MAEIIIYIFCIYGIISMIIDLGIMIKSRIKWNYPMIKLVVMVKNQEEVIEGIVREFARNMFSMPAKALTIIDMGSDDDTLPILKRLQRRFEFLEILKKDERDNVFKDFEG